MNFDLHQSLRTAAIRLAWAYVVVLILAVVSATYLDHFLHTRLANAFAQSARNDLLTRDLRKAIAILNPSLRSSFKSVSFFTSGGEFVFALPTEKEETTSKNSPWNRTIEIPIGTGSEAETGPHNNLRFTYAWTPTAATCLALWLAVLLLAYPIFQKLRLGIERRHRDILKNRSAEIIAGISTQVAHDIRSPLAALEVAIAQATSMPEENKLLVSNATKRIRDIANDLLQKDRRASAPPESNSETVQLDEAIESIVLEKQAEYHDRSTIRIEAGIQDNLAAQVSQRDLKRVLSNLINNAMEATTQGTVNVSLRREGEIALIEVVDTGQGIPEKVLKSLGTRGASHKKEGSGLGLFHAKQCAQAWGGEFEIHSQVGKGTRCILKFPQRREVVLIDDDTLTHQSWQMSAKHKGISLRCFADYRTFEANLENIPSNIEIYIDSDLKPEQLKGEDLARKLFDQGYKNIFLATGTPASKFPDMPWIKSIVGKEPPWL